MVAGHILETALRTALGNKISEQKWSKENAGNDFQVSESLLLPEHKRQIFSKYA